MPKLFFTNNNLSDTETENARATCWSVDDTTSITNNDANGKPGMVCKHVPLGNDGKLTGKIHQIQFSEATNWRPKLILQFSSVSVRTKFQNILKETLGYQIEVTPGESTERAPNITFLGNLRKCAESFNTAFLTINMIETLPLPMLKHLYKLMDGEGNYHELNEKAIIHTLYQAYQPYQSYQDENVFPDLINRALVLARGYGNADMFLVIANYLAQHAGLERFVLEAALQGLDLVQKNLTVKTYTSSATIQALHFRAGNAIRLCGLDFLKALAAPLQTQLLNDAYPSQSKSAKVKSNATAKDKSKTAASHSAANNTAAVALLDVKGVKESAAQPKPILSLDDEEDIRVDLKERDDHTFQDKAPVVKIENENDRNQQALHHFLQVTDPNSKFYLDARKASTEIFASIMGNGQGAVDPTNRVIVMGANRTVDTLINLAARMQKMQQQILDQSILLKKDGADPEKLLNDHKGKAEQYRQDLEKLKAEFEKKKAEVVALESRIQSTTQSFDQRISVLTKEKEAETKKLQDKDRELKACQESDQAARAEVIKFSEKSEADEEQLKTLKADLDKLKIEMNSLQKNKEALESELSQEKKAHSVTKLDLQSRKVTGSSSNVVSLTNAANQSLAASDSSAVTSTSAAIESTSAASAKESASQSPSSSAAKDTTSPAPLLAQFAATTSSATTISAATGTAATTAASAEPSADHASGAATSGDADSTNAASVSPKSAAK